MTVPDAAERVSSSVVGSAIPDESAGLHVTGAAQYVDDVPEPDRTLHVALGLSPIAHGRVVSLDTGILRRMPGVVAVLTAADIPGDNNCGTILHDESILADTHVTYLGQPVFAVVARSRAVARRCAARASEVLRLEPLPAVLDPLQAHADGDHVIPVLELQRETGAGLDASLAAGPHRFQGTLSVGGQEHFYLESHVALAEPGDDGMLVRSSTQHPTEVQKLVARTLGVPQHAVRVECRRMGGGFGGKESQAAQFACIAALAAHATGCPAKLRLDRADDDLITGKRHPFRYAFDVAHDDDGRILAMDVTMVAEAGHSADLSGPVLTRAICHVDNAYWLPNVAIHAFAARTNTQSNTAFRGFGGPQGALVTEMVIDSIARRLGVDPVDVRARNFYGARQPMAATDPGVTTPYGQAVEDNVIHELVAELLATSDYRQRREAVARFNADNVVLKRGIALTPVKFGVSFNVSHFNQAGALVHVYTDGSVLVNHSATEMGQGVNTKVLQVVAQELGVGLSRVRSTATNTEKVANTSATAASTGSDMNGKAAQQAAQRIRGRLAEVAAPMLEADPSEVVFQDETVRAGGRSIPWADVVEAAYLQRVQLWSEGFYATPGLHWDTTALVGHPFFYFAYGASVSEVVVDTLTGESRVLRADLLHDVGRSLNPAIDIGQVEGAFVQGMGWLTTEELRWDDVTGRLLTQAPTTYKIPTANDVPQDLRVRLFENASAADTIHLSKAVGEPPLLLSFSVLLAIRDAISSVGGHRVDPPLNAPATAEEVLRVLDLVRAAGTPGGGP